MHDNCKIFFLRDDIEKILPHRISAQMIDEAQYDPHLPHIMMGMKFLHEDDPWFVGHYPGNPIFPGHCQWECAQLVAALLVYKLFPDLDGTPVVAGADGVRFKEPVRPGDLLTIKVEFVEQKTGLFFCKSMIVNQHGKTTARIKQIIGTIIQ